MTLPLDAYPLVRTRDPDELLSAVSRTYGHAFVDLPRGTSGFNVVANHRQLQNIGFTYGSHGAAIDFELPGFDGFAQLFSFKGVAAAGAGRNPQEVSGRQSFVASPGETVRLNYEAGFEQLVLKVSSAALTAKLEALTGSTLKGPLRFDEVSAQNDFLRRLVLFTIESLDAADTPFGSAAILAEIEQAIMVAFLYGNRHNFSYLLEARPGDSSKRQVRDAEEYMQQHWNQPLTIETLASVTGVSARSLFHSFKQDRGYSPMEFMRGVRLQKARDLLSSPAPDTSVIATALFCGFGNQGHFATHYRRRFGETPLQTLQCGKAGRFKRSP